MNRWVWLGEPDEAGDRRVVTYLLCDGEPTPRQRALRLLGPSDDYAVVSDAPWTLVPPEAGLVGDDWRLTPDGKWLSPDWS